MLRKWLLSMMTKLSYDVITALQGCTLVTAESCTGGGIGAALTSVPGSSAVYKGGIISYTNEVKIDQLGVDAQLLQQKGAVSAAVAEAMAVGAREKLGADIAVSVTGLAGPDGDDFGNPVGTVFVGYSDKKCQKVKTFHFSGEREAIRNQTVCAALELVLQMCNVRVIEEPRS